MAEATNEFPTTLGPDSLFKGQLQFEKGARILGKFEGEVTSEGTLLVGEGAAVTGDLKAATIRIEGQIKGNLNASSKILLSSSGRLEGDLQTQRLEVSEGAVLIGKCVVGVNGQGSKIAEARAAMRPVESQQPQKPKTPEPAVAVRK